MITPASAAEPADTEASTAQDNCKLQYPPECEVGPVDCNFGHPPAADDCEVTLEAAQSAECEVGDQVACETGPVCDLQYPAYCEAGPVSCTIGHASGVADCEVALETTSSPIPPPCFVDETVEAGETSVRITIGHCS